MNKNAQAYLGGTMLLLIITAIAGGFILSGAIHNPIKHIINNTVSTCVSTATGDVCTHRVGG